MKRRKVITVLALLTALIPLLNIPSSWKVLPVVIFSLFIAASAYGVDHLVKEFYTNVGASRKKKREDAFGGESVIQDGYHAAQAE